MTWVFFLVSFDRQEGLSKCGKCKQAYYCNVDCQVKGDVCKHSSHTELKRDAQLRHHHCA